MNMKKIASVALAAALSASLLAGCGGSGEGGSDSVTLKIGDNWGATHPMAAALDTVFKTQIEEQTGGAVKVEVYHDGLLGDEAALSKLSAEWAAALAARLPELDRRGRTFLELRAELQTDGLELAWFTIQRDQGLRLCFQGGGHSQMVLFGADFSLREEGQPALEQPGSAGNFLAFVLLEEPPLSVKMPPWAIRLVVPTPALEQAAREAAEEAKAAGLDLIDLDELPQL